MTTITVQQAQANLATLIDNLPPGEEIIITSNDEPIAKLIRQAPRPKQPRQPGSAKDKIVYMAEDFDAPLEDFKEYME